MTTERTEHSDTTLTELHQQIQQCRRCPLHLERKNAVAGEGPADARLMFIGEAPGRMEDQTGQPFMGRSGEFLDHLLATNGLERSEVYITSAVKCRPPENRTPHKEELIICRRSWLDRQIERVDPELIVLLGRAAIGQTFGETGLLEDLHGTVRNLDSRMYMLTFHPAAAIRFGAIAHAMREDFMRLHRLLKRPPTEPASSHA